MEIKICREITGMIESKITTRLTMAEAAEEAGAAAHRRAGRQVVVAADAERQAMGGVSVVASSVACALIKLTLLITKT